MTGKPRSEIIREAVTQYCNQLLDDNKQTWASNFVPVHSGNNDLATNKDRLKKIISSRFLAECCNSS